MKPNALDENEEDSLEAPHLCICGLFRFNHFNGYIHQAPISIKARHASKLGRKRRFLPLQSNLAGSKTTTINRPVRQSSNHSNNNNKQRRQHPTHSCDMATLRDGHQWGSNFNFHNHCNKCHYTGRQQEEPMTYIFVVTASISIAATPACINDNKKTYAPSLVESS